MNRKANRRYRSTESKYKGGAQEMYITYDLKQKTRSGSAIYPKVKRVYIAGDVKDWKKGNLKKRSGNTVNGVAINYEQTRAGYRRKGYTAKRNGTRYQVKPTSVPKTSQEFRKVVEVPKNALHVQFYKTRGKLPGKYQNALQNVR